MEKRHRFLIVALAPVSASSHPSHTPPFLARPSLSLKPNPTPHQKPQHPNRYLSALDPEVSSKTQSGIQQFRAAAEGALAAAGLHLTEAQALWQEYRCVGGGGCTCVDNEFVCGVVQREV